MQDHECKGCREYAGLSRRGFLGMSAGAAAALAIPTWLPRVAMAAEPGGRDVLISIFLRGGCDGLTFCYPHFENAYYSLRPTIAIPAPDSSLAGRGVDLDGRFGLPAAMSSLLDAYGAGDLAIVHACGLPATSRSHFDAMYYMEVGQEQPPGDLISGWLGRHLLATSPASPEALLRAIALGFGLPRSLVGAPLALPMQDPGAFGIAGPPATMDERRRALFEMHVDPEDVLTASARSSLDTIDLLETIDFEGYQPSGGASYPETETGEAMRSAAALIKAEIGVEAISLDVDGWDTHEFQGPMDGGMAALMGSLADSLAAFHADLEADSVENVTVVAMSEFGRNAFENGSQGTDHGHGGVMLVLGHNVNGGRVVTDWPGLDASELYEDQDLRITIDYRDVLTELLEKRVDNPDWQSVFVDPGYSPTDRGIFV